MLVLIPTAIGQTVPSRVLHGLTSQSVPVDIVQIATPGCTAGNRTHTPERKFGEATSRAGCIYAAGGRSDDVVVMQDRDAVHLRPDNLHDMLHALTSDPDLAAVALRACNDVPETDGHVRLTCVMFRASFFRVIDFLACRTSAVCPCIHVQHAAEIWNGRFEYLDDLKRIEEIEVPV